MAASTRADSPRSVASGFSISIGTPRSTAAMIGSTCRCSSVAMMGAGHLRPLEELAMVVGDEIGADLLGNVEPAVVVLLGDADPLHRRVPRRHLAAEQPDAAGADDGEPDAFRLPSHRLPPAISATADSAAFDSGRSTGSLRSAERSAAV